MVDQAKIMEIMEEFTNKIDEVFIGQTPKIEGNLDDAYDCDIYIFRHPGMGNSKQIITGNKISIMTATSSYLDTLVRQQIITVEELEDMFSLILKQCKEN